MAILFVRPPVPIHRVEKIITKFRKQEFEDVEVVFEDKPQPLGAGTTFAFSGASEEKREAAAAWYKAELARFGHKTGLG